MKTINPWKYMVIAWAAHKVFRLARALHKAKRLARRRIHHELVTKYDDL